jgi:hypothetical protein
MKIYRGQRDASGVWVTVDGQPLPERRDLVNHSLTGFEWGYGGSGPAQLALAIVADCLGDDDLALAAYQPFKWQCVAKLPYERFELPESQVREIACAIRGERQVQRERTERRLRAAAAARPHSGGTAS